MFFFFAMFFFFLGSDGYKDLYSDEPPRCRIFLKRVVLITAWPLLAWRNPNGTRPCLGSDGASQMISLWLCQT